MAAGAELKLHRRQNQKILRRTSSPPKNASDPLQHSQVPVDAEIRQKPPTGEIADSKRTRCSSSLLKAEAVIRAAFLSSGLYLVLCGTGLMFVDDFRLSERVTVEKSAWVGALTHADPSGRHHVHPPEWLPFTCIGVGGVTMLYAVALPRQ